MEYTTVDRIFAKISRDYKRDDISEQDIVEWVGEALSFIGASCIYDPAIAFIKVENHQCILPKNYFVLFQIARNNAFQSVTPTEVSAITASTENTIDIPVALDANGTPIHEYELAYYRPYFDFIGEYYVTGYITENLRQFTPVRLSNHMFFNSIVCKQADYDKIYQNCHDEYTIVENLLRFSFESGQVAVSYLKYRLDCDTGYPLIPDHVSFITAITKYVIMKITDRDFYNRREGSQMLIDRSEREWQWYCKQAQNFNKLPQTIDEWENLMRQWNYMLPRTDRYDTFFSKQSHTENRKLIR